MNKNQTLEYIEKICKDGDVINISNHSPFWKLHVRIACWGIRKAQRNLFENADQKYMYNGKEVTIKPNEDTHSMIKFSRKTIVSHIMNDSSLNEAYKQKVSKILDKNPWSKTFSVEPPRATFIPVDDYAMDDISIYRHTKKDITDDDIKKMLHGTLPIIDTKYDYGQLINILANQVLGYEFDEKIKMFDFGAGRKVCSVGVAAVYQYWRKQLENIGIEKQRLFSKLNESNWDKDFITRYNKKKRWDVENTYPCMFGVTKSHFDGEFELIAKLYKGKIQYSKY